MNGIIGKKIGMISIFDGLGCNIVCIVIEVGLCVIMQVKIIEIDGYNVVQFGFGEVKVKNIF